MTCDDQKFSISEKEQSHMEFDARYGVLGSLLAGIAFGALFYLW